MRDFAEIVRILTWASALAAFVIVGWAIYHWDIFPRRRLRNHLFGEVKIGQTFYDFGGEELKLQEYKKTGKLEAECLNVAGHPVVKFEETDVVKIEVFWI